MKNPIANWLRRRAEKRAAAKGKQQVELEAKTKQLTEAYGSVREELESMGFRTFHKWSHRPDASRGTFFALDPNNKPVRCDVYPQGVFNLRKL